MEGTKGNRLETCAAEHDKLVELYSLLKNSREHTPLPIESVKEY